MSVRSPLWLVLAFAPFVSAADQPLPPGAIARLGGRPFNHAAPIRGLAFLPDGKTIVTASSGSLLYWDVEKATLTRTVQVHTNAIQNLAISTDGKLAVMNVGAKDAGLVWDLEKDKEIARLEGPVNPRKLAFTDDNRTIVAFAESKLCVWDAATGKRRKLDPEPPGGFQSLAVSPTGSVAALVYKDGITLWDFTRHAQVSRIDRPDIAHYPVVFSPDGKSLFFAKHNLCERWQVASGKLQTTKQVEVNGATTAVFLNNETVLLVGPNDWLVRLTFEGGQADLFQVGSCNDLRLLALSRDGKRGVTLARDPRTLHVFDTKTGTQLHNKAGHPQSVSQLALSADGKYLVSGVDPDQVEDGAPRVWELATLRQLPDLDKNRGYPALFNVSSTGTIAAVMFDETVRRWPLTGGKELKPLPIRQGDFPMTVAYAPDGKALAIGYESGLVDIVDADTGKSLPRELMKLTTMVQRLAYSPDGRLLAVGSGQNSSIWLYSAGSGRQRRLLTHASFPKRGQGTIAFSPDSRMLAVNHRRGIVVFELHTGDVRLNITGLTNAKAAVFSADGRTLIVGSGDNSIRFFDVFGGEERPRLTGNSGIESLVAFPDGKRLASGCADGTILLWDVADRINVPRPNLPLTERERASLPSLLGDLDSELAWQALARLARADSASAASSLRHRLTPATAPNDVAIQKLIADLDSNAFRTRDRAEKELQRFGPLARPALKQALATKPSDETIERLERLLRRLVDDEPPSHSTFELRALEALERNGGSECRVELQRLAGGAPEALLTIEARFSLERVTRKLP